MLTGTRGGSLCWGVLMVLLWRLSRRLVTASSSVGPPPASPQSCAASCSAEVTAVLQRRKLKMTATFESASSYFSFTTGTRRCQAGVNLGSIWGQHAPPYRAGRGHAHLNIPRRVGLRHFGEQARRLEVHL